LELLALAPPFPPLEVTILATMRFEPTSPWGEGEEIVTKPILF